MRIATYLINKLPFVILDGKSSYEILFDKPPKIDHLMVLDVCVRKVSCLEKISLLQELGKLY